MFLPNEKAAERFFGFFTANHPNKNMWRADCKAACRFAGWCEGSGTARPGSLKPLRVATHIGRLAVAKCFQPFVIIDMDEIKSSHPFMRAAGTRGASANSR